MLLNGGISLHLAACGALMVTAKTGHSQDYEQLPRGESDEGTKDDRQASFPLRCWAAWKRGLDKLELRLLISLRFWAVSYVYCISSLTYHLWLIYFVSLAQSNGFSPDEAAFFVTIAGVACMIARIIQGPIIDRGILPFWGTFAVIILIISTSFFATPFLTSNWSMMMSASLILFGFGALFCLSDVLVRQVMGVELVAGSYGWIGNILAMLTIGLGFFPGKSNSGTSLLLVIILYI